MDSSFQGGPKAVQGRPGKAKGLQKVPKITPPQGPNDIQKAPQIHQKSLKKQSENVLNNDQDFDDEKHLGTAGDPPQAFSINPN